MATLLAKNALVLATMDDQRREIPGGGFFARDGWIEAVGTTDELPADADEVLDLSGRVVMPGLVNTHHHLYQTLTRAIGAAQDVGLFGWLKALYPLWSRLTPEAVSSATQVGAAEMVLSGCTTLFDHQYLWPNGSSLADQVEAAREVGVRFVGSRGSMSLGEKDGGLTPDSLVESEHKILADSMAVVEAHHDPEPGSLTQIVLAPCSPFTVTPELMKESAALARELGVRLHTHLAETADEEQFCLDRHGKRPVAYAADLGWVGDDVWFAHAVHVDDSEIDMLAESGTGVAHCPTSNMRLASGVAPLRNFLESGVRVGIGVDGSASNDGNHMLAEARQAMLMARLAVAPADDDLLSARSALELATRGGAAVLGRPELGSLETGHVCDFIAIDVERVEFAGALHDPVAAVVFAAPVGVDVSYVNGRPLVREGQLLTVDLPAVVERHNRLAAELMG